MTRHFFVAVVMFATFGCTQEKADEPVSANPTQSFSSQCSYVNVKNDTSYFGPCLQTQFEDGHIEFVGGGFKFVFSAKPRIQGQWMFTEMNGKPAVRYEINREKVTYATEDLEEFLDVE